ncbi:hypothetical protein [Pontibacter oryzae]|uniref:Uncharacterized protein n=1 Tax=Pontibacter oryzae TaxID=2304593 RepID=A0A399SKX9_9BACT|nr:hypothetical protein [Pontibacter oryzae]RIJ43123.1 hypothetical protein D1627_04665 [Pontibacter oryzae]
MNSVLKVYLLIYYFINLVLAYWAVGLSEQRNPLVVIFMVVGFWVFAVLVLLGLHLTGLVGFKKAMNKLGLVLATPLLPWVLMKMAGAW